MDALLLKGPALARLLYRPGERRPYVDLDVLISPAHLGEAAAVLAGLGYRNAGSLTGIDDVGGVVHGSTWFSPVGAQPHEIDVHRWLAGARADPLVAWEALWRRRTEVVVGGRELPVLDRAGQALQLALHQAQHGPGYQKGILDLTLALERWPRDVWEGAWVLAQELDAGPAFAAGLRLLAPGAQLADDLSLPVQPALAWEIEHGAERPRGTFHVEALRSARSFRERAGVLRRALLPNRRWLAIEFHWAQRGGVWLILGYAAHLLRVPVWALRALIFRRRARRARSQAP